MMKAEILKRSDRLIRTSGLTAKIRTPWLSFAFAGLAVIAFIIIQPKNNADENLYTQTVSESSVMSEKSIARNDMIYPDYYPRPEPVGVPIADTREFMKTNYSAEILTREPDEKAQRIQLAIRGLGGRVDSFTASEEYGYVRFVLPENKLEQFRNEIKTLAPARFIRQTISGTNLLPQVRMLEEQKKSDKQLLDSVATVHGTISFQWISVWEILDIYFGDYWLAIALVLAAIVSYLFNRRSQHIGI